MTDLTGNLLIQGPAGRLEAILKEPPGAVVRAAIVCHPHPLFGGTMHNKVVFRIARAFQDAGFAVLRFNFRGTGRSEGTHDGWRGEQDDLRAAIEFLAVKYPQTDTWLAGFSFGAGVMLRVGCGDHRARALIAAGLAVSTNEFSLDHACDKPKLFVQGELDEFGAPDELTRLVDKLAGPKDVRIVPGADHFFEGHLPELYHLVSEFIASISSNP